MTNKYFIEDLETVEGALYDLIKISQLDVDITNILKLIHDRLQAALPDVTQMLIHEDLMTAIKEGQLDWSSDVEKVLRREVTVEELIAQKTEAA